MYRSLLISICVVTMLPAAARANECISTDIFRAQTFSGEIAGGHIYVQQIEHNLRLELHPIEFGWRIDIRSNDGSDLTSDTPTPRFSVSSRDLEGWHFRNAVNNGPNTGGINAPQQVRRFSFAAGASHEKSRGQLQGLGWLKIQDMGLADLQPGQNARLVYLRFNGCLLIPRTAEEIQRNTDIESAIFLPEEFEQAASCGLSPRYQLKAWILPRWMDGDFDGDGATDFAMPVVRISDGSRTIAICRAGTWLSLLQDPLALGPDLPPKDYLKRMEAWKIDPVALEKSESQSIILERIEKSAYRLNWNESEFEVEQLYGPESR